MNRASANFRGKNPTILSRCIKGKKTHMLLLVLWKYLQTLKNVLLICTNGLATWARKL